MENSNMIQKSFLAWIGIAIIGILLVFVGILLEYEMYNIVYVISGVATLYSIYTFIMLVDSIKERERNRRALQDDARIAKLKAHLGEGND